MEKIRQKDVTATKSTVSGAWNLSALVGNQLVRYSYIGYTKRESIRLFVKAINTGEL